MRMHELVIITTGSEKLSYSGTVTFKSQDDSIVKFALSQQQIEDIQQLLMTEVRELARSI
jgi:hypothetical protein